MAYWIKIKPLSVNICWKGKRYKTDEYKSYEKQLLLMLPKVTIPTGELELDLEFGVSNSCADWDNPIKPFVDILQKAYNFDDKNITKATVKKTKTKKGSEYIFFNIYPFVGNYKNNS